MACLNICSFMLVLLVNSYYMTDANLLKKKRGKLVEVPAASKPTQTAGFVEKLTKHVEKLKKANKVKVKGFNPAGGDSAPAIKKSEQERPNTTSSTDAISPKAKSAFSFLKKPVKAKGTNEKMIPSKAEVKAEETAGVKAEVNTKGASKVNAGVKAEVNAEENAEGAAEVNAGVNAEGAAVVNAGVNKEENAGVNAEENAGVKADGATEGGTAPRKGKGQTKAAEEGKESEKILPKTKAPTTAVVTTDMSTNQLNLTTTPVTEDVNTTKITTATAGASIQAKVQTKDDKTLPTESAPVTALLPSTSVATTVKAAPKETTLTEGGSTITAKKTSNFKEVDCLKNIEKVSCFINPCENVECKQFPAAECRNNRCGECTAQFFLNDILVLCASTSAPAKEKEDGVVAKASTSAPAKEHKDKVVTKATVPAVVDDDDAVVDERYDGVVVTVDGGWSHWSSWSKCSALCGGGETQRNRTCTEPAPRGGGNLCDGSLAQQQTVDVDAAACNEQACQTGKNLNVIDKKEKNKEIDDKLNEDNLDPDDKAINEDVNKYFAKDDDVTIVDLKRNAEKKMKKKEPSFLDGIHTPFFFFITLLILCLSYFVFTNRRKIMGMIVERGSSSPRDNRGRYNKLKKNVEEVIPGLRKHVA